MYKTLSGDPIQRYIYKSFCKTKLIAKKTNLIAKRTNLIAKKTNLIEKPYKLYKMWNKLPNNIRTEKRIKSFIRLLYKNLLDTYKFKQHPNFIYIIIF